MPMLPAELLRDSLPDPLPHPEQRRSRRWRDLVSTLRAQPPFRSEQEAFDRRVRRDNVQAIVREAFQETVTEQDDEHRGPDAFAQAWRLYLSRLLDQVTVEVPGWSPITMSAEDVDLAWDIYILGCLSREKAIKNAILGPTAQTDRGRSASTFEFSIISEGRSLGDVIYGVCQPCGVGLLMKISFDMEWHCCGFGRGALSHLQARYPDLVWSTTGQSGYAQGFYRRIRSGSDSPWEPNQHPCRHFE